MIITIDTSKDSKEDIRKAIVFLESLHTEISTSLGSDSGATNAFANMFGASETPASEIKEESSSDGFVNIFADDTLSQPVSEPVAEVKDTPFDDPLKMLNEKKDDEDEVPQVMQY